MLNNLSIRKKLAVVALGPLLLLLALSALRIKGDLNDSSAANDTQARVTASALTGQMFDAVRTEAVENQNAVAVSGLDLDAVRTETDAAIARWSEAVGDLTSIDGGSLASTVEDFNAHRADVAAQFASGTGAEAVYEADVQVLRTIAAFDGMLSSGTTTDSRNLQHAADLTSVATSVSELQLLGMWSSHAQVVPAGLPAAIGASRSSVRTYGARNGTELAVAEGSYEQLVDELAALSAGDAVAISSGDWRSESDARATQLSNARATEVAAASTSAVDAQSSAQSAMRNAGLLALVGLILAAAAIVAVAKVFVESLRVLRDEAAQLADNDLPGLAQSLSTGQAVGDLRTARDIDNLGSDEIGEVAVGLGAIRQSAADLGDRVSSLQGGIADTFVNLARRNQSLVDRQLEAIDTLEAEERDSDRLSLMYRVDHLATRMRRNAESLLVLADAKTPERHSPAVELREVLRVAIGEVEDYRRIIPIALDDLHVAGHRAQDLAHLLAELMENAAQHSPPGTAVDVAGAIDRQSGDYTITILDHGTGVDPQQRVELNELLAAPPTSTLTISHSIGLQVVRRLAHALGLHVNLVDAAGGGLEAKVTVPSSVVADWAHTAARPATTQQAAAPAVVVPSAEPAPVPQSAPMPEALAPEAFTPEAFTPEVLAPEVLAPEVLAPEVLAPEVFTPEVFTPEVFEPAATPEPAMVFEPQPVVEDLPPSPIDTAVPMNLASLDSLMSAGAVEVPEAPVIPTIDMPSLDLPSLGSIQEDVFEEPAANEFVSNSDVFTDLDTPGLSTESPMFDDEPESISDFDAFIDEPVFDAMPTPPEVPPVFDSPPSVPDVPAPVAEASPVTQPDQPVAVPSMAAAAAPTPEVTPAGLVRRQRQPLDSTPMVDLEADRTAPSQRTPDQVKNMLSRYKTGLERGRGAVGTDGE